MSIESEINRIKGNISSAFTACSNKGATLPASQTSATLATAVNDITELKGETRTVSITSTSGNTFTPSSGKNGITSIKVNPTNQNRTVTPSTTSQTLSVNSDYSGNGTITVNAVTSAVDSNITAENIKKDVSILGVTGTYEGSTSDITQHSDDNYVILKNGEIDYIKKGSTTLGAKSTLINNSEQFAYAYQIGSSNPRCNIVIASFGSVTTISGFKALTYFMDSSTYGTGRTELVSLNMRNLTTISGYAACEWMCANCDKLANVNFDNLKNIKNTRIFSCAFRSTGLKTLSFPALTSTSFGSYNDQFNDMLYRVTDCTVHFPSNLQSVIGSWSSVTSGFSGTNTTILFDLPATT